ncbi:MAG: DUF2202 domain-containing protein [Phaeodactylibacter sp.]|nr:DUF2202 domain-containing protein [Phaeodactylibacter sp.]MCB9049575.1 DUF2202 domain-containing protein [Lewinellaceae bacterium]
MKKLMIALLALAWPAFQALQAQTSLSQDEQKTLIFLAEEEKMAHDFYQAMETKWGAKVFNHIVEAEQRHLSRLAELAAAQSVTLPESLTSGKAGKFKNKDLQQLYDGLITTGNQSLEAALRAGARVEESDIRDLKQALETTGNEELRSTYQYLAEASGNHLRAFNKNLTAQGVAYQPVLLSQADFDAIVAVEGGGQGCQGNKGQGCCQNKQGKQGQGCCQNKGGKQGQGCQGKGKGRQSMD